MPTGNLSNRLPTSQLKTSFLAVTFLLFRLFLWLFRIIDGLTEWTRPVTVIIRYGQDRAFPVVAETARTDVEAFRAIRIFVTHIFCPLSSF